MMRFRSYSEIRPANQHRTEIAVFSGDRRKPIVDNTSAASSR